MTALSAITWHLDTGAGHWLPLPDLQALTAWMDDNDVIGATADRPIDVADGVIAYGRDFSPSHVRAPHRDIRTVTAPLVTAPPHIFQPTCGDSAVAEFVDVLRRHEWSAGFGGTCASCSAVTTDVRGLIWCHRDGAVLWPCPPVRDALIKAGLPMAAPLPGRDPIRVVGDCLDPATQARIFGVAS